MSSNYLVGGLLRINEAGPLRSVVIDFGSAAVFALLEIFMVTTSAALLALR